MIEKFKGKEDMAMIYIEGKFMVEMKLFGTMMWFQRGSTV